MWQFFFGDFNDNKSHYIVMDAYDNCWRLLKNDKPIYISKDHAQLFGREHPLNLVEEMKTILRNIHICKIERDINTEDIFFIFENEVVIEFFRYSMGYENWHLHIDDKHYEL